MCKYEFLSKSTSESVSEIFFEILLIFAEVIGKTQDSGFVDSRLLC